MHVYCNLLKLRFDEENMKEYKKKVSLFTIIHLLAIKIKVEKIKYEKY